MEVRVGAASRIEAFAFSPESQTLVGAIVAAR
jgi:hypothetical protein